MKSKIFKIIVSVVNVLLLSIFIVSGKVYAYDEEVDYDSALTELTSVFDFQTLYEKLITGTPIEELMIQMEEKKNTEYRVLIQLEKDSLLTRYIDKGYSLSYADYVNTIESTTYKNVLVEEQAKMKSRIQSEIKNIKFLDAYYDVFNGFSAVLKFKDIEKLENIVDIEKVIISELFSTPETVETEEVEEELTNDSPDMMDVTEVWEEFGYEGQGMLVAVLDTGLDLNHPAFAKDPIMSALDYDTVDYIAGSTSAAQSYYSSQLAETSDLSTIKDLTGSDLYKSAKVPFAFDYADGDTNVIPSEYAVDYLGNSHGTHVAGIVAGNDDKLTGVAPEAQLAIMKVFSDEASGAYSDVLMSALSDCLYLGVDCINMSLGTPGGFSREIDSDYINEIYDQIRSLGINLYCSAGNSYSSTFMSPGGDYPLASNPDFGIASSSSSYYASTSVASIESILNTSLPYFVVNKGTEDEANVLFTDGSFYVDEVSTPRDFLQELVSDGHLTLTENKTFEYVTISGNGEEADFEGIDLTGKIALVKRGVISFEDKAKNAEKAGAIAIIVYDNIPEYGLSVAVENETIPMASVTLDDGSQMAKKQTGTIEIGLGLDYGGGTMSTFSSWGPLPSLELKPEITAPGGNVFSAIPFGGYTTMSGTSMASPNMAAAGALVRQYVEDMYSLSSDFDTEILVNRLLMSTATIVEDLYGNPYSPRKQGAGLANVYNAINSRAYIYVFGEDKPKLELGDDKEETGVYELNFRVVNFGTTSLSYKIDTTVLTETLVSSMYLGQRADVLEDYSVTMDVKDGELNGDILTVDSYKEAKVSVKIKLSDETKQYLHNAFENGIYVEGFVTLEAQEEDSVDLSIPWLSFFGDWTKAPIIDNSIDDEEAATMTNTGVSGYVSFYGGAWESQFGTFIWDETQEIDFNFEEYISMCPSAEEGVLGIYSIYTGLLRGCKEIVYTAHDMSTGEVIYQDTAVNARKSYYEHGYGYVIPYYYDIMFPSYEIPNNTWISFEVDAYLDYADPQNNKRNIFKFNVFVDNSAAEVVEQEEYDVYHKDGRTYVDVPVIDNHFILDYSLWTFSGDEYYPRGTEYLTENPIIVRDYKLGEINVLTLDITDYKEKLQKDENGNYNLVISLEDYALNASAYNIKIPYEEINSISINHTNLELNINDTELLEVTFNPTTSWNQDLKWSSSNEEVVKVIDGRILAISEGSAVITALALDTADYENPLQVSCTVTVSGNVSDGTRVEELIYTKDYYEVLVGEELTLELEVNPWYSNDIIYWESSDSSIAAVENGVVTAISTNGENYQEVTIKAYVNEEVYVETEVTILNEFTFLVDETGGVFDGKKFVIYYNGKGGDIAIPEGVYGILDYTFVGNTNVTSVTFPESIEFLGEHAFYSSNIEKVDFSSCKSVSFMRGAFACCYNLKEAILPETVYSDLSLFHTCTSLENIKMPENWHQRLYEYDEDSNLVGYDKYTDYLNTITDSTFANCEKITSIDIPDTVNKIEFYAFYNCTGLKSIELKENIQELGMYAFDKAGFEILDLTNTSLTEIPMFAFAECGSLTKVILKEGITTIDAGAFYYCKNLSEINFPSTLKDYIDEEENYINGIGAQAFYDTALTEVDLSNTQIEVIGSSAFIYCSDLETVIFPNTLKEIMDYAFYNHAAGTKEDGTVDTETYPKLANVTFGSSLEKIGDYAFTNTGNLKTINLPESLKEIGSYTFSNTGLLNVVIPANVDIIGTYAFSSNAYLTSVKFNSGSKLEVIPEGFLYLSTELVEIIWPTALLEVGSYAFEQTKIVSIVLPESVIKIDRYAFSYMAALKDIVFNSTNLEELGQFAFSRTTTLENVIFNGNVERIENYAFIYTNIKSIVLPNGLTYIGADGTFVDCQSLETIIFQKDTILVEDGVYRFSAFLFLDSPNIKEFIVHEDNKYYQDIDGFLYDKAEDGSAKTLLMAPRTYSGSYTMVEGVETVAPYAFMNVKGLTELNLNDVTTILYRGFHGCSNISSVDLTDVSTIGLGAFSECTKLKDITLPTEVKELGESAFSLTAVEEVTIPGTYKEIPGQLFYHCQSLRTVIIEEGITSIGNSAFEIISTYDADESGLRYNIVYEESALTNVTIPSTVTQIGNRAFAGASKLSEVIIPDAVLFIGDGAFDGCESLEVIDLKNVVNIGVEAFRGCKNLIEVTVSKYTTYIYEAAFKDCVSLLEFRLPERLIYLGQYAFVGCSYLEKITVPKGMGPIMLISSTFDGCIRLEEINVEEGNRSYESVDGVLFTKDLVELVVYPIGKKDNSYTLPNEVLSIYHEAFINNEYLQEVVLNSKLQAIGDKAFFNCNNLVRVVSLAAVAPALRYYYEIGPMDGFSLDVVYRENNFKRQVLEYKYNGLTSDMELVIPSNAVGYDTNSWKLYFPTITYSSETMGKETIELFNSIEDLYVTSLSQKAEVEQLLEIYNNLTDVQKAYITNIDRLNAAVQKIAQLEEIANSNEKVLNVINQINNLSTESTMEEVKSVKELYDELTNEEQEKVTNYIDLELYLSNLENQNNLNNLEIINEFINKVNAVINSSFEEKDDLITSANTYYETISHKEIVADIYEVLTNEINKHNNQKVAKEVISLINEIKNVTASSDSLIANAEKAYNELTDEQKEYVTNYHELVAARSTYNNLINTNKNNKNLTITISVSGVIVVILTISLVVVCIKRKH